MGYIRFIGKGRRAKGRRLTPLMVMSNIGAFAQQFDSLYTPMDKANTASIRLLPQDRGAVRTVNFKTTTVD